MNKEDLDPKYNWVEVVDLGVKEPTYIRGTLKGCTCEKNDSYFCIEGRVIGPCESDLCGGICTFAYDCDCAVCHG